MHTSPVSTGVTRCLESSCNALGTVPSSGDLYGTKIPSSSARLSSVLSTPKNTSPSGLLFVRMAWFTAAPASPDGSTFTVTPVSFLNWRKMPFDVLNESCVLSVIVVLSDFDGVGAATAGTATATTARSVITSVSVRERRMSGPSDVGLHGEQGAVVERDAGHWLAGLVADTPG